MQLNAGLRDILSIQELNTVQFYPELLVIGKNKMFLFPLKYILSKVCFSAISPAQNPFTYFQLIPNYMALRTHCTQIGKHSQM